MGCNCRKYHIGQAARDAVKRDFASNAVRLERLAVCEACTNLIASLTCRLCGCFVGVKARFRRATCPEGRW